MEIDDDHVHPISSHVQTISSFDDIQQLISTSNWIPITIFLNFLLTDTNSDPSHLVDFLDQRSIVFRLDSFSYSIYSSKNSVFAKPTIEVNLFDGYSNFIPRSL